MHKVFFLILLVVLITISTNGCSFAHNGSSTTSERLYSIGDVPSSNLSEPSSSISELNNSSVIKDSEIESAQKVAVAYYKGTTWKPKSFQYDTANRLYKQYSSEYEKDKLIVFTVTIENSEDPPRGIALVKSDTNSDWKVLGEGY